MSEPVRVSSDRPSSATSVADVYNRLGRVETRIETTRAELEGLTQRTTAAIEALTLRTMSAVDTLNAALAAFRAEVLKYQESNRPQYLGVVSIIVATVAMVGTLTASFLNARVSPIEHDIISAERVNSTKHQEIDRRILEEVDRNEKRHIGQQAQVQAMLEKLLETRERIAYNNARIEEMQRVIFHSPLAQGQPVIAQPRAGNAP